MSDERTNGPGSGQEPSKEIVQRAIASGTIFGGLVDCYVLEDKTRVISKRGAVKALTRDAENTEKSGATNPTALGRYLSRLPSKYAHMSTRPTLRFRHQQGGMADGITAEEFYDILVAYSESADIGELTHPAQLRIAANCNRLVRACGKVGIVALVDEATGYQADRAANELRTLVDHYLRETPGEWQILWDKNVVSRLCRLYGIERRGESFPTFACNVIGKLYKLILPAEVYAEMRNRNGSGDERKGKLHQYFKEALWRFVHNDIPFVAYIARVSKSRQEFWNHMHARYADQSFQLGMDIDEAGE